VGVEKIVVLGTGGTIAGMATDGNAPLDYQAAQQGVGQLLAALPALRDWGVEVLAEQVVQIDSKDMDFEVLRALVQRCQVHLQDPSVRGLVITHGTDTLEETAWLLHHVLLAHKPVVLTAAMRPANAVDADGPRNLQDACVLAQTSNVRGVLVLMSGQVHSPLHVRKLHPYRIDALGSEPAQPLAQWQGRDWVWAQPLKVMCEADRLRAQQYADALMLCQQWPWVEIVTSGAGSTGATVDALVAAGVNGLVVAGTGNATVHHALEQALLRAKSKGVAVVRSTRCTQGSAEQVGANPLPLAQGLFPVQARWAMWLDLLLKPPVVPT
jgi:L-asparaginase